MLDPNQIEEELWSIAEQAARLAGVRTDPTADDDVIVEPREGGWMLKRAFTFAVLNDPGVSEAESRTKLSLATKFFAVPAMKLMQRYDATVGVNLFDAPDPNFDHQTHPVKTASELQALLASAVVTKPRRVRVYFQLEAAIPERAPKPVDESTQLSPYRRVSMALDGVVAHGASRELYVSYECEPDPDSLIDPNLVTCQLTVEVDNGDSSIVPLKLRLKSLINKVNETFTALEHDGATIRAIPNGKSSVEVVSQMMAGRGGRHGARTRLFSVPFNVIFAPTLDRPNEDA